MAPEITNQDTLMGSSFIAQNSNVETTQEIGSQTESMVQSPEESRVEALKEEFLEISGLVKKISLANLNFINDEDRAYKGEKQKIEYKKNKKIITGIMFISAAICIGIFVAGLIYAPFLLPATLKLIGFIFSISALLATGTGLSMRYFATRERAGKKGSNMAILNAQMKMIQGLSEEIGKEEKAFEKQRERIDDFLKKGEVLDVYEVNRLSILIEGYKNSLEEISIVEKVMQTAMNLKLNQFKKFFFKGNKKELEKYIKEKGKEKTSVILESFMNTEKFKNFKLSSEDPSQLKELIKNIKKCEEKKQIIGNLLPKLKITNNEENRKSAQDLKNNSSSNRLHRTRSLPDIRPFKTM